jgi:hypothetical protein
METDASGAIFSPCMRYRFQLWRCWNLSAMPVCFLMLNPSTADEVDNDPTVERCERRARMWGYGGLFVTNLFALRSTDPRALYSATDPVGDGNDEMIVHTAARSSLVVCAWGKHGAHMERGLRVLRMLHQNNVKPHALAMNVDRSPAHPLYLPYTFQPFEMEKTLWLQ